MYTRGTTKAAFGIHQDENSVRAVVKSTKPAATRRNVLGDLGNRANPIIGDKRKEAKVKSTKTIARNKQLRLTEDPEPMDLDDHTTEKAVLPPGVDDIDTDEAQNPQLVTDYIGEIDSYMKGLERKQKVEDAYLRLQQVDITDSMRAILLDWLVEVHLRFKLAQETLFMTVHILDRFLSVHRITRGKLQLAGITAMLIASKYEDMYPPEVRDFIWIADNAYSRAEIIEMEGLILKCLDYNLGTPLPLHFFRRLSKATSADAEIHHLGKYLMELSVCNYNMCGYEASKVATSAMFLAHSIMDPGQEAWSKNLEYYSGYSKADVNVCIQKMGTVLCGVKNAKQQAIRRKFASSKLLKVSELPEINNYIDGR